MMRTSPLRRAASALSGRQDHDLGDAKPLHTVGGHRDERKWPPLGSLLAVLLASLALVALILQVRDNGVARHRQGREGGWDRRSDWRREEGITPSLLETNGAGDSAKVVRAAFDVAGVSAEETPREPSHRGFALTRDGLFDTSGGKNKEDWHDLNVMISTTTSDPLGKILDWAEYHRLIGVDAFYMFVEGAAAAPEVVEELRKFPGMLVWEPSPELDERREKSRIWRESWLGKFFDKPCNNELFVRQSLNMEIAILEAQRRNVDWHIHIDTDELLNPTGHTEFNVKPVLGAVPRDVDLLVFPNYEACPETDDVSDPFREVTLFKRNFDHVVRNTYMENYKAVTRENPNYFLTYGNGKSAARVQEGLRPNGAHRFHNYVKTPVEIKAKEASVLHYTYTTFDNILSRKNRCDCEKDEESLKKCFILPFDRVLYTAWDEMNEEEMRKFYNQRVVYHDEDLKAKILSNGLFSRIYTPQLIIEGVRAARAARDVNGQGRDELARGSAFANGEEEKKKSSL